MKYIIHSNIEFDTTEYILKSLNDSNSSVKLSNSAGRILEELITHRNSGSPVTREHLFTVVWKSHGLEPSNGNLNQQISLIRKTLTAFGLDSSSIITIPKRGLKLSNQLTIKKIQDEFIATNASSHQTMPSNNNISSTSMLLSFKSYIRYIITLIITFIFILSISFIYLYNKKDNIKLYCCKEMNTCSICTFPSTSGFECNDYSTPYFEII